MDTISLAEATSRLGTNLPRLRRTMDRLGISRTPRPARLTDQQLELIRSKLGTASRVDGLSRIETQVLAALSRAPLGFLSVRSLARRARVSPTAAGKAVRSLQAEGLVKRRRDWIAAGRARQFDVILANVTAPAWTKLAPDLARVQLAAVKVNHPQITTIPQRLRHLFWNADTGKLNITEHGAYIAERLLTAQDLDGLAWGLSALSSEDWKRAATNRGLTPAERGMAINIARHRGRELE